MEEETKTKASELKKACTNCGAELLYAPGSTQLICEYCGNKEAIVPSKIPFKELKLKPYLEKQGAQSHSEVLTMIQCKNCGANQHIEDNYKSLHCIYCSMPLVIADIKEEEWILPGAVLPFQINHDKAHNIFKKWVDGLWFAPNNLKKAALDPDLTRGLYLPYWTFDAQLDADYSGKQGTYYYVTVSYNTMENGKSVRKTRQEQRTRWTSTSGRISGFIDDTLIKASAQRTGQIPQKIERWNLKLLKPFNSSYLSGFVTEKYTISLNKGHLESKDEASEIAKYWAKQDIGGDTQRITSLNMRLSNETFKHILLPVYISNYKFKGKTYHFYVNGENGTISGQRPYSVWKIFFLVVVVIILVIALGTLAGNG
ncbi:MAG: DNA helicase PriA [Aestuariibaculum sp.]